MTLDTRTAALLPGIPVAGAPARAACPESAFPLRARASLVRHTLEVPGEYEIGE